MKYEYSRENNTLMISLDEDVDMHTCKIIRSVIDGYILRYEPKEFILDLKDVNFMDSSGVGLLIGRYNLIKFFGTKMIILNVTDNIRKLLQLSNLSSQIEIRSEVS